MAKTAVTLTEIGPFLAGRFDEVSGLIRITEGEESQAFAFVGDSKPLILRINADVGGFERDKLAQRFDGPSLPVPSVRLIAPIGDAFACVSDRASGLTLQDLPPGGAYVYGAAVGDVLDAMAGCDLDGLSGFGPMNETGQGLFQSWWDWIGRGAWLAETGWLDRLPAEQRAFIRRVMAEVAEFGATAPDRRALVHGDFGSNNVLCEDGHITAVIDWSEMMIGDPLYDLANILFWRSWLDCMEMQARFFERQQPWRLAEADTLRIYQLRIGLQTLFDAGDDRRLTGWTLDRLTALVAPPRP